MKYGTLFNACPRSQGAGTPSEKEQMDNNQNDPCCRLHQSVFRLPSFKNTTCGLVYLADFWDTREIR